jgi:hypothetical protein
VPEIEFIRGAYLRCRRTCLRMRADHRVFVLDEWQRHRPGIVEQPCLDRLRLALDRTAICEAVELAFSTTSGSTAIRLIRNVDTLPAWLVRAIRAVRSVKAATD